MNPKKNRLRIVMWLAFFIALTPLSVFAAPDLGLTPSCQDQSILNFLVPLFGSLFANCGGTEGAFEKALGVLNGGALVLAGLFAAYIGVAGTAQTAHDGEMLGKKWSSLWLPIRTTLAVALIVPIKSGYCVAQLIVAFCISQGIGLADNTWNAFLQAYVTPQGMAPKASLPKVDDLARSVLLNLLCLEATNLIRDSIGDQSIIEKPFTIYTDADGVRHYGSSQHSECGSLTFNRAPLTTGNAMNGVHSIDFDLSPLSAVQQAHLDALTQMEADLQPIARKIAESYQKNQNGPDIPLSLEKAIQKYQTKVAASASSVFGNPSTLTSMIKAAKNDGWYAAGLWLMKAAQMQDALNQVVSNTPTAVSPSAQYIKEFHSGLAPYFSHMQELVRNSTQGQSAQLINSGSLDQIGNSSNPFQKAMQKLMNTLLGGNWIQAISTIDQNRHSLMAVKDMGDYLMTSSEAGIALGLAVVGGAEAIKSENSSFIGQVLGTFTGGMTTLLGGATAGTMSAVGLMMIFLSCGLFAFSSIIAIYVPISPFLLYFGAFLGWLILCAEAVIAAPLWGLMHLSDGHNLMGGSRQGYMLILGVTLRPVLIVLGFIFAMTSTDIVIRAFSLVFFPAFKLSMTGSVIGLGTSILMIGIYFGTIISVTHTTFGFIHIIPDKILRYIGGGHEQLGETAKGLNRAGEEAATNMSHKNQAMQDNAVRGLQTKALIDANTDSMGWDSRQEANNNYIVSERTMNEALIADSKSQSPYSNNSERLQSIASHLNADRQAQAAIDSQDRSDKRNHTNERPELENQLNPQQQFHRESANNQAEQMMSKALESEKLWQDNPTQQNKLNAQNDFDDAAKAFKMLSNHENSQLQNVEGHSERSKNFKEKYDRCMLGPQEKED